MKRVNLWLRREKKEVQNQLQKGEKRRESYFRLFATRLNKSAVLDSLTVGFVIP